MDLSLGKSLTLSIVSGKLLSNGSQARGRVEALDRGDNPPNPCQNVNQDFYASRDSVLDRVSGSATLPMRMSQACDCPPDCWYS